MQWTVKQKSFNNSMLPNYDMNLSWAMHCFIKFSAFLQHLHKKNSSEWWLYHKVLGGQKGDARTLCNSRGRYARSPKIFKCAESLVMPWLDTFVCLSPSPLKFWKTWKKRSCISRIGLLKEFFLPQALLYLSEPQKQTI